MHLIQVIKSLSPVLCATLTLKNINTENQQLTSDRFVIWVIRSYFCSMFIRKNRNRSSSVSIQIVQKFERSNKVIKTIGIAKTKREQELLLLLARTEIDRHQGTQSLFVEHDDLVVENFVNSISNNHLQIIGSELILGKIYDKIGFPKDGSSADLNKKN